MLSCVWLCDPMDCSPPGSSVHGILQARILKLVAIPFSKGSFQPRDWTPVSHIAGRFFTIWVTGEALKCSEFFQINEKNKHIPIERAVKDTNKQPKMQMNQKHKNMLCLSGNSRWFKGLLYGEM